MEGSIKRQPSHRVIFSFVYEILITIHFFLLVEIYKLCKKKKSKNLKYYCSDLATTYLTADAVPKNTKSESGKMLSRGRFISNRPGR